MMSSPSGAGYCATDSRERSSFFGVDLGLVAGGFFVRLAEAGVVAAGLFALRFAAVAAVAVFGVD